MEENEKFDLGLFLVHVGTALLVVAAFATIVSLAVSSHKPRDLSDKPLSEAICSEVATRAKDKAIGVECVRIRSGLVCADDNSFTCTFYPTATSGTK